MFPRRHASHAEFNKVTRLRDVNAEAADKLLKAFGLDSTQAEAVDAMCLERNLHHHPQSLHRLDDNVREALQSLATYPDLLQSGPTAAQLVLSYEHTGRHYIVNVSITP